MRSPAGTEGMLRGGGGLRNPCDYLRGSDWRRDSACRLCRWPQRPTRAARRVRVAPQWSCSVRQVHPAGFRSRPAWPAAIPPLPLAAEADACSAAGEGGTEVILFFVPSASCGFPLASGERVTSLCSPEQSFRSAAGRAGNFSLLVQRKVTKRKHVQAEHPTGGPARSSASGCMFQSNSVTPIGSATRFACRYLVTSEANTLSACNGRVVYGAFIPSQNPRAGPPRDALLSRCFLVTSLHQQRSDPLGPRPSGSFALVSKEVTRSAAGRAEALAVKVIKTQRGRAEALL